MSNVLTIELDDVFASKLDALARALDRPKSWLIEQAITNYVEEQSWEVEAIA